MTNLKLKLSVRILLGYLIPLMAILASGFAIHLRSSEVRESVNEHVQASQFVEHVKMLEVHSARLQAVARGLMLTPREEGYVDFAITLDGVQREIAFLKNRRLLGYVGEDGHGLFREIERIVNKVEAHTRDQVDQVKSGNLQEARRLYVDGTSLQDFDEFDLALNRLLALVKQHQTDRLVNAEQGMQSISITIWTTITIALLFSLLAGILLSRQIGSRMRGLTSTIASFADQIKTATTEHERTMADQVSSVVETTAVVGQVGATSRSNSEQSILALKSAEESQKTVQKGTLVVEQSREGMKQLERTIISHSGKVKALSEQSEKVVELSVALNNIAAEIKVLGLNASVEAAHAGKEGKGFAAISSEVRKLAEESKLSSGKARQIVGEIKKTMLEMKLSTEENVKLVQTVSENVDEVSDSFDKIREISNDVRISAQQVQLNSSQQASALSQVGVAMGEINDGAREIASGTAQIRAGMENLVKMSGELNELA